MTDWSNAPRDVEWWREAWNAARPHTAAGPFDMELVDIDEDHVVLRMPITDASRQPFGLFHGGISMLLAESAASFHSCYNADLTEVGPVGIEISGSHLNSAREGWVRCTARVVKRGRTLVVHEVHVEHEETGKPLCRGRVTNLFVPHRV